MLDLFKYGVIGQPTLVNLHTVPEPPPPAPVFTKQPGDNATTGTAGGVTSTAVLYQAGNTLSISAGEASNSASWQWQKQNGSAWSDVAGQTAARLRIAPAVAGDAGVYRVIVRNAGGEAVSNTITVENTFLALQHLNSTAIPPAPAQDPTDKTKWTLQGTVGTNIPILSFVRKAATPDVNYMGIMSGLSVIVDDQTIATASINTSSPRRTDINPVKAGSTQVKIHFAALEAVIALTNT